MMHVTVMIISYSALILGSLLSIAFLILISTFSEKSFTSVFSRMPISLFSNHENHKFLNLELSLPNVDSSNIGEDRKTSPKSEMDPLTTVFGSKQVMASPYPDPKKYGSTVLVKGLGDLEAIKESKIGASKTKMTLAWNFDNLSYRVLGIGFPFLTIGILSGAVWANEAWGSYWSWDPKETWALLTWLIFAIYLHARITKGWQGKKPAIIASFGFLAIWICFLGVNLIGEGLHSYGWFSHS
jgi:cytochrome c-type biogenesis protein CcsB